MEPWQSWAIIGAIGAGGYWYYTNSQKPNRGRTQKPPAANQAQRRSSNVRDESIGRKKKGKGKVANDGGKNATGVADISSASATTSGNEKATKRKGGKKQPSNLGQSSAVVVEPNHDIDAAFNEPEETMDNKEFAKQMSGLKAGTSLTKANTAGETRKTKKQGKQNGSHQAPLNGKAVEPKGGAGSHEISTTSSTTGADADDDLSPVATPGLGTFPPTSNAGGVADMLEAPAKGPSVLRLTEPAHPQPERQQKPKKAAPEPETKKQRQNRQKTEEKKAGREEAEKERRVLMEKQRRIAREAEGRPAKNGLGSMPPTANAWSQPTEAAVPTSSHTAKSPNANGSLLDTFDESSSKSVMRSAVADNNDSAEDRKNWDQDIPSEEEQMRMLSEMDDDGWNTVQKGGKATKKKAASAIDKEESVSASEANTNGNGHVNGRAAAERKKPTAITVSSSGARGPPSPMAGIVPPKFKTTKDQVDPKIWNRSNIRNHPEYDPEYPYALTGHPEDSDWAVV